MDQELKYHRERALAELDRAISADSFIAAEVHFRLSSLHLKRAERLRDGEQEGAAPNLFAF